MENQRLTRRGGARKVSPVSNIPWRHLSKIQEWPIGQSPAVPDERGFMMSQRGQWSGWNAAIAALGLLVVAGSVMAAPQSERVTPQRLTVFVGQGDYRVQIEGSDLAGVDHVVAVDTSQAGYMKDVPEVAVRVLNRTNTGMTVLIRADSAPGNGNRLQLRLIYGGQGYLVPSAQFQFDVR
jgi:hypothetical protein